MKIGVDDFDLIKVIGRGSYGKVFCVQSKVNGRVYAMKVLKKKNVVRSNLAAFADKENRIDLSSLLQQGGHRLLEIKSLTERQVLEQTNHPFVSKLKFAFQTSKKLYLGMEFLSGGELFFHLQRYGRFPEPLVRFYAAELIAAIQHLHSNAGGNIIYRDLKPENILLDAEGHIRVVDFGLAKLGVKDEKGAKTFVGSPEYVAPEILDIEFQVGLLKHCTNPLTS